MHIKCCRTLTEQNKALTVRNAQLEAEVSGERRNERFLELEQAMADVQAENARLQVCMHASNMFAMMVVAGHNTAGDYLHASIPTRCVHECK